MDDLERLLADEEKSTPSPAEEVKPQEDEMADEAKRKEEQLINLGKAIEEAQSELKTLRTQKKSIVVEEDELPKIDLEDPSTKAWDKHIGEKVNPTLAQFEQQKLEVRGSALREFLADKPNLSKSPEKLKGLMDTYESLSRGRITELTKEGILPYLEKAYAAEFHQSLLSSARSSQVERAKDDILFSDIAVSRGATSYSNEIPSKKQLSKEDEDIVSKWDRTLSQIGVNTDKL